MYVIKLNIFPLGMCDWFKIVNDFYNMTTSYKHTDIIFFTRESNINNKDLQYFPFAFRSKHYTTLITYMTSKHNKFMKYEPKEFILVNETGIQPRHLQHI